MRNNVLVRIEGVGKKFCRSLRRSLWYGVKDVFSELAGKRREQIRLRKQEFWAVRDLSFTVARGETLGLIGHNGAGKTTLLRMLNGIIKPDIGRIEVRGCVQALIALGAGFNPVLTGRENVYINASVLGIAKSETDRLFDEIVAFSGIEEFIDMPVQSYSSGMVVRLGFSIAAHMEPDVLLVDEVLAVGDLAFRTKCQLRIQELKNSGVAIILVSHNLHTISHICTRAVTMENGKLIYDGDVENAIDAYRSSLIRSAQIVEDGERGGTGEIRIQNIEILDDGQRIRSEFSVGDPLAIRCFYKTVRPVENPVFNITFNLLGSHHVAGIRSDMDHVDFGILDGEGHIDINIPQLNLLPNVYTIGAKIFHPDGYTFYDKSEIVPTLVIKGGNNINGIAYLPHSWRRQ